LAEIEKSITSCDVDIAAILGSVSTVYDKSFVEKNEKVIESKTEELEEFTKEKNPFEEDEKYYSYLADCFSNKSGGFKKYFIGEMIGTFNENISKFVPFFFNEKISISFDKDLNDIIEMDDEKISYKSLSRGQKTRAELAIAFALFELSRYYYSNCNNILMVDEMLDEGLDQFGMRAAISVLQGFTDTTVYVISHNDELKNLIENKIEITRDENEFSVIKE
jgi:DNA repair exonuclease SbcCD ATPase subunit